MSDERVNKYILGDMSPEEVAEFEAELGSNPDLKNALHRAQGTLEAIRIYQQEQSRAHLRAHRAKKKDRTQTVRWGVGIAATILILSSGFWLWDYFQPPTAPSSVSSPEFSQSLEPATLLTLACEEMHSTLNPNTKGAAPRDSLPNFPEIKTLTSICEKALATSRDSIRGWISILETQLSESPNSSYQGQTYYFLGLLHLELGEREQAKTALQQNQDFMQGPTKALLKNLE